MMKPGTLTLCVLCQDGRFYYQNEFNGWANGVAWKIRMDADGRAALFVPYPMADENSDGMVWRAKRILANLGIKSRVCVYRCDGWVDFGDGVRRAAEVGIEFVEPIPRSMLHRNDIGYVQPMRSGGVLLDFCRPWG